MGKIYKPLFKNVKIAELVSTYAEEGVVTGKVNEVGYGKVLCNPKYSHATFVGCSLAFLQ